MRPYWAVFSARCRVLLQYRAAAMAGAGTQLFWGLIRMMIFLGFYASSTAPQPMSPEQAVSYIWLGQAMLILIMFRADGEIAGMVRSGNVVYELARPVHLYRLWFARAVASRTAPLFLRMAPIYALALVLFGLQAPASAGAAAMFALSLVAAILMSAAVGVILTVSLLWTISGEGVTRIMPAFVWLTSGLIVPLPLYPDWAQPLLAFLPFRGLGDTPFRIYLGMTSNAEAWATLAHQAIWTVVFVAVGHLLLARATRRLVVQGG